VTPILVGGGGGILFGAVDHIRGPPFPLKTPISRAVSGGIVCTGAIVDEGVAGNGDGVG